MSEPRWAVVVGNAKTRRNETVDRLIPRLRAAGLRVGGVIQRPSPGGQQIEDLTTGAAMPLGQMNAKKADLCSWSFDDAAFGAARQWIEAEARDVTFIPVGRLEGQRKGHWPAVAAAFDRPGLVILTVSPTLLPRWALTLPDPVAGVECPAEDADLDAFVADVLALDLG